MNSHTSVDNERKTGRGGRSLARPLFLVLTLFVVAAAIFAWAAPARSSTIPTIAITSVVTDQTVTIQTANFPANQNFVVTMGPFGTQGVNGYVVGNTNSGAGGSFSATYNIPAELRGSQRIAIRMQTTHANPFVAYNWFWNNTSSGGTGGVPGYSGVPTFSIVSVDPGKTVTVDTNNFPPNQTFTVMMGPFGTQAINGTVVGTLNSGVGGTLRATFNIPANLATAYQIAMRMQTSHPAPFFAYNWFYNNTTGTGGVPPTQPVPPVTTTAPTFTVCSVVQNQTVTIKTKDFPPNQTFTVTMGPFGTQAIGGIVVGTLNSGVGGALTATFNIPSQLAGSSRIAIRAQTAHASPIFAYNWFYNTTATVC